MNPSPSEALAQQVNDAFERTYAKLGFAAPEMWTTHLDLLREQVISLIGGSDENLRDFAAKAIRAASWTDDGDDGPYFPDARFIHVLVGTFGMDVLLDVALSLVRKADEIAWIRHPDAHDLQVRVGDKTYRFDVPNPARS